MSANVQPITLVRDAAPVAAAKRPQARIVARVDDLSPEMKADLAALRMAALSCRSAARLDVFEACASLSLEPDPSVSTEALIRALPQAFGLRPVLFRPGNPAVSFDEAWLLRLIDAQRMGRTDDAAFLLTSRVAASMRRHVGFLAGAIARPRRKGRR